MSVSETMIFTTSEVPVSVFTAESDPLEPPAQTTVTLRGCCFPGAWALASHQPPTAVWAPGPHIPSLLSDRHPLLGSPVSVGAAEERAALD